MIFILNTMKQVLSVCKSASDAMFGTTPEDVIKLSRDSDNIFGNWGYYEDPENWIYSTCSGVVFGLSNNKAFISTNSKGIEENIKSKYPELSTPDAQYHLIKGTETESMEARAYLDWYKDPSDFYNLMCNAEIEHRIESTLKGGFFLESSTAKVKIGILYPRTAILKSYRGEPFELKSITFEDYSSVLILNQCT